MKKYRVELNDDEMFLVLKALGLKVEAAIPEAAEQYKKLHDRLERIYEDRT